jgi:2',3'-cyclic-nucleotide 2'-phosphodiesterase (5'-nucleotidase family)
LPPQLEPHGAILEPGSKGDRTRRDFLKEIGSIGTGLGIGPALASCLERQADAADLAASQAVRNGKAQHLTILHTSDIHAQLEIHDEFFLERGRPVFKRRGGFATLRTMIGALRQQNPGRTLVVDGGDCFQGSAVAALSKGQAIVPLINRIGYDLVLPGNWEVVYGKDMLIKDMSMYTARKVCANMFHAGLPDADPLFPPYQVFDVGGMRVGFVGYNDPLTPIRQAPAYSRGIRFSRPDADLASYVKILRRDKGCHVVFVLSHMGLAQQLNLANQPDAKGVDYILGADTHERIREPLQGAFSKVTEPGAFGSFVGKLDLVVEDGAIKDQNYELLDVDPERYHEDPEMRTLVAAAREPYRDQISRVIGKTRTPLLRYYVIETPMDNLITDALMWKFKTDFVLSNGFRFCPPLVPPPGGEAEITYEYLWSMLPVESAIKTGVVSGQQILDWLENELENAFASDATKRFGGWFVRYNGLFVKFTIGKPRGGRVEEVRVQGRPLDAIGRYRVLGCEREGDPDNTVCRIVDVADPLRHDVTVHDVVMAYLAEHSPVAPVIEGRAVATDAPADLLSQVEGTSYSFR